MTSRGGSARRPGVDARSAAPTGSNGQSVHQQTRPSKTQADSYSALKTLFVQVKQQLASCSHEHMVWLVEAHSSQLLLLPAPGTCAGLLLAARAAL